METRKIVINRYYGGDFGLSAEAVWRLRELGCEEARRVTLSGEVGPDGEVMEYDVGYMRSLRRDDPLLVRVVEEMGTAADGVYAELMVVEIPADIEWVLHKDDGFETVEEAHRQWP